MMFCPTYKVNGKVQAYQSSLDSFRAIQSPDGVRVDFVIGMDNPYGAEGRHKNTLHQYQQARKQALEGGYDALLTVEHDMLIPEDALIKLWKSKGDVVYGLYVLRHGAGVVNCMRHIEGSPNIDSSLSLYPKDYHRADRHGWVRCSGVGMGCTLIRRNALEAIPFRQADEGSYAPDWMLSTDCVRQKFLQICRFDVKCGHIDNGIDIWPGGKNTMSGVRVKIITDFVGIIDGRSTPLHAGQVIEADMEAAREYERAGFLSILDDGPATVKIIHKRAGKVEVK